MWGQGNLQRAGNMCHPFIRKGLCSGYRPHSRQSQIPPGPALHFFLPCSYDLGSRDSFLLDFCVLSPGITLSTTQVPMLMEIVAAAAAFTVVIIY